MKYEIWDGVSYGHMEEMVPFTLLTKTDDLAEVRTYLDENDTDTRTLFVTTPEGEIIIRTDKKIFESPDGKIIFQRTPLTTTRKQI